MTNTGSDNGETRGHKEPMTITTAWSSPRAFFEAVGGLLDRTHEAAENYANSSPVLALSDNVHHRNGKSLSWSIDFDLKDLCVLAAIIQAPLALRGAPDCEGAPT